MDSLGPLIGPVVPPAETTRPMRVRSERASSSSSSSSAPAGAVTPFLRGGCTKRPPVCVVYSARNSCAIDVIERRFAMLVSDRAATTANRWLRISLCLFLFLLAKGSRRRIRCNMEENTVDRCGYCSFPRMSEITLCVGNLFMGTR